LAARKWLLLSVIATVGALVAKVSAEGHASKAALAIARAHSQVASGEIEEIPDRVYSESKTHAQRADCYRPLSMVLLIAAVPPWVVSMWKRESRKAEFVVIPWTIALLSQALIV
jgi:hypothetical protein